MTQIQPLWNAQCAGCHAVGGGSAGLTLGGANSHLNIVNVPSTQVSGLMLVQPGNAAQSYLFEKINCDMPQVGIRMRPGSAMTLAQQALVRDWINQGALPSAGGGGNGNGDGGGGEDGGGCAVEQDTGVAWLIVAIVLALAACSTLGVNRARRANGGVQRA
jgi:hypothetical protein